MPFDVDDISATPLAGATIKALSLSSYDASTNKLTINFSKSATSLTAGTPYIVKWTATGAPVSSPVFGGVIDGETTGVDVRGKMSDVRGEYYDLSGRRLSGQPTQKGIYIHQGKKKVVK